MNKYMGVLMRFEWYLVVTGCGDGCVGVGVGGWASEFWTSGIVCNNTHISISRVCLTQFVQKVD